MPSTLRSRSRVRELLTASLVVFVPLVVPSPAPPPLLMAQAPVGIRPDSLERLAEKAIAAVVVVSVDAPTGPRQGSGFLVEPGGVLITNYHVIRDARQASVRLASGDVYDHVTVLAIDERRDIAVLGIQGYELPTLPLGNSDSVRVGSPAIAIGSPLGLQNTVSTGIVSGRRDREGFRLLQISAPSSPGSSGGPVLSLRGDVIGIAVSQMRDGQNLNFAVPINYVRGLLTNLEREPVAVLAPGPATASAPTVGASMSSGGGDVNTRLSLDLRSFPGYAVEVQGRSAEDRWRRGRVTFRRIETLGDRDPRIERYEESETIEHEGPSAQPEVVRRERSRTIALADGLRPLSARGEVSWRGAEEEWRTLSYELRFDGDRVRGTITDSTGVRRAVDHELPPGVVPREMRDLAFSSLAADSLIGKSVELTTFDPLTSEVTTDRYDVRDRTTIGVLGRTYSVLRVELASGLSNTTEYFGVTPPHVLLRCEAADGLRSLEAVDVELFFPAPRADGSRS